MDMTVSVDEMEALFDVLPDVVFFVKDSAGRYTHANLTLVRRLGLKKRSEVVGCRTTDLFPAQMGNSYASQDHRVLQGEVIENQLEVHIFSSREHGWCLTCKRPLRVRNEIGGVIGISRDLGRPDGCDPTYARLSHVLGHLQENHANNIRVRSVAVMADVSVAQLERQFRRVFQLTPQQVLTKLRIEAVMRLLQSSESIAAIGLACGFTDQSAFARQFKSTVGMTPRDYRAMQKRSTT